MKGNSLYRDNVALLYRHFDGYRTNSRMFMAPLPFEVKYVLCTGRRKELMTIRPVRTPIPLGALFLCWQQCPELFSVDTPAGRSMIFSFNGSPLSGRNSYSAVNLETGEVTEGEDAPGFMERCRVLDSAAEMSGRMLEEMLERTGRKALDFVPSTLDEVVAFVRNWEQ